MSSNSTIASTLNAAAAATAAAPPDSSSSSSTTAAAAASSSSPATTAASCSRDLGAAPPPPHPLIIRPHARHHHHLPFHHNNPSSASSSSSAALSSHKGGASPLKATLPMSSVLRGPIASQALLFAAATTTPSSSSGGGAGAFEALSPPPPLQSAAMLLRHVSPPAEYIATTCGGGAGGGGGRGGAIPRAGCLIRRESSFGRSNIIGANRSTASTGNGSTTHNSPSAQHQQISSSSSSLSSMMRRTASLDALYLRPSALFVAQQHPLPAASRDFAVLQLDKATQTLESYLDGAAAAAAAQNNSSSGSSCTSAGAVQSTAEKVSLPRQPRLQRTNTTTATTGTGGLTVMAVVGTQLAGNALMYGGSDHSVSSQTFSPAHAKAIPMTIPVRPSPSHARPMRNSVEGLNQEIEKLVLQPDQPHTCRPETNLFSRGDTPEGHRAPTVDLLHGYGSGSGNAGGINVAAAAGPSDRRSVNTQTPSHELLSSDDSQSASPDDCASSSGTGASPRINRFLAREPPDGCEKVSLKLTDAADQLPFSGHTHLFKPCVGFRLRPSLGSAFQPIVATSRLTQQPSSASAEDVDGAAAGTDESAQ